MTISYTYRKNMYAKTRFHIHITGKCIDFGKKET